VPDYSIFGECLRSELLFSDLPPTKGARPRWILRLAAKPEAMNGPVIGEMLNPPCAVKLRKDGNGFRLSHSCTADYDVSGDGENITCVPIPAAESESLRYDIQNRVMAVALHAGGALCLHGSAVEISGGVVAFLAPKGYGKSTLASALLRAGARFVTDDMVIVELSPRVAALPGIFGLRLRDDSAQELLTPQTPTRRGVDGKHVIDSFADDRMMLKKAPLSAVYILAPVPSSSRETNLTRVPLSPRAGAIAMITHARIGALLGTTEAPVLLDRAVTIAKQIPVCRLEVPRDLQRLDSVVKQLLAWHSASSPAD
jgi:hypothetical protein